MDRRCLGVHDVRWDDLQLLRLIDELEEREPGLLSTGLSLMQRIAGAGLDHENDPPLFARELLLAHHAGYITFDDRAVWPANTDPLTNAFSWVQQIRDIRLTIEGRDRARGRVIMRPLPDPEEDDDRPIAGITLEEIARAIGDTYTGSQLPRFLLDSGVPAEYVSSFAGESKWAYLMSLFERLHEGGSASRRSLREFLSRWLENRLHTGPRADVRDRILAQLARQGWFVREDRLVIGEPQAGEIPSAPPVGREARLAALHPVIRQVTDRYLESGHMEVAIFEGFKAINNRVRELTGIDADGSELVGKAFSEQNPRLVVADLSTQPGRNIPAGFRLMLTGAIRGIRNPDAHELFKPLDDEEALEKLSFASMLMRRLDEAMVVGG
jgi:uncharacterized protein (TIGR02391 family)